MTARKFRFTARPCAPADHTGTWGTAVPKRGWGAICSFRVTLSVPARIRRDCQALRIYYPRFSLPARVLARGLPGRRGVHIIPRSLNLANTEGFLTVLEKDRAHARRFSIRARADGGLDWLASWVGVTLDLSWGEQKRRLFSGSSARKYPRARDEGRSERAIRLTLEPCPTTLCSILLPAALRATAANYAGSSFSMRVVRAILTRQAPASFSPSERVAESGCDDGGNAWIPALWRGDAPPDFEAPQTHIKVWTPECELVTTLRDSTTRTCASRDRAGEQGAETRC